MAKKKPYKNDKPIRLTATDEEIRKAVAQAKSYAAALRYLGLTPTGANHSWIKSNIMRLKISTKHMTGCGWSAGQSIPPRPQAKRPWEEILVKDSDYTSTNSLKKRLINEGKLENICSICGIVDWAGKPLALHLDHINGIRNDNRIENLRILCPNCHSQTETYAGRGRKTKAEINRCMDCEKQISSESARCKPCAGKAQKGVPKGKQLNDQGVFVVIKESRCEHCYRPRQYKNGRTHCKSCSGMLSTKGKIAWPPLEDLQQMVSETNYTKVGRDLGVSDNAVRKHIRNQLSLQARRKAFGYPDA